MAFGTAINMQKSIIIDNNNFSEIYVADAEAHSSLAT